MLDLELIKKCLRVSPTLYFNASKFYHATPFGKRRIAKLNDELSEHLRVRLKYKCSLAREYFNDDWTVRQGLFAGMRYAPMTAGCLTLMPKLVGSYESFIHPWVTEAIGEELSYHP
jgi:hypothetical protein